VRVDLVSRDVMSLRSCDPHVSADQKLKQLEKLADKQRPTERYSRLD
jgi:hypothetical protein